MRKSVREAHNKFDLIRDLVRKSVNVKISESSTKYPSEDDIDIEHRADDA